MGTVSNLLAGILPRLIAQNTMSQAPPAQEPPTPQVSQVPGAGPDMTPGPDGMPTGQFIAAQQSAPQSPQLDPLAQHILQQSVQSPQDLYEKYRRLYFGLDPEDKNAQPTTKQRIKKGALEVLRGLLEPGYQAMPDRLRAEAQKDFVLQTPRLGIAAPLENLMARIQQLQVSNEYNNRKLDEAKRYNEEKGQNAEARNLINLYGVRGRNDNAATRNDILQRQLDQNAPLIAARTNLLGTQNQNLVDNRGLVGPYAAMAQMLHMTPEQSADFLKNGKGIRDSTRFAPQAGGAGGGTYRLNFMPHTTFNQATGELETENQVTAINPRTLEMAAVGNIKQPVGALTPKDIEKVNDFGSAATMARQLAQAIGNSVATGKAADYMGLLQGNGLSASARATGVFGNSKDFNESMYQILKANGLFQHISSFAGKRITNRELDYMNKVLGRQTDTPESALAAAVAASQLLETAQLQKAKVLPDTVNPTPMMQAEADRFLKEAKAGKNPTLRSMREIFAQNGVLRKTGASSGDGSSTPGTPAIDKALLDRINKKLAEKKGQ